MPRARAPPFVRRDFFGGAITAELPPEYVDISTVRDVPDNQECFAHQDTDRSLIVEILEFEDSYDDEKAARYFFMDLADANGSENNEIELQEAVADKRSMTALRQFRDARMNIVIGTQEVAKFRESAKNVIRVFLCNLRLPGFKSDVLISFNTPVLVDPDSSSARALREGGFSLTGDPTKQAEEVQVFRRFVSTFLIANPELFGAV